MTNVLNDRTPVDTVRSINNARSIVRPQLRPAVGPTGAVAATETLTSRDFPVTAPRLRNFGVTAIYRF